MEQYIILVLVPDCGIETFNNVDLSFVMLFRRYDFYQGFASTLNAF